MRYILQLRSVAIADLNFPFKTIRGTASMGRSVGIFWLLLLVAPLASAQIFKCVAKDGTDLYQNFPCGIDSIGSMPTNGQSEKAGLAQGDSKQAKPNASSPAGAARKSII